MSNRQEFTRQVRVEILKRATRPDGQPACERCGAIGVKLDVHHRFMDAMKLAEDKKGKLTAADGECLCSPCHDPITAGQRKVLAKALRVEAKSTGATRPTQSIKSAPFPPSPKGKRPPRDPVSGMTGMQRRFSNV